MLVLSRYKGEALIIQVGSERIKVIVAEVRGNKVRIGVEASDHISINREEVQEKIDGDST